MLEFFELELVLWLLLDECALTKEALKEILARLCLTLPPAPAAYNEVLIFPEV